MYDRRPESFRHRTSLDRHTQCGRRKVFYWKWKRFRSHSSKNFFIFWNIIYGNSSHNFPFQDSLTCLTCDEMKLSCLKNRPDEDAEHTENDFPQEDTKRKTQILQVPESHHNIKKYWESINLGSLRLLDSHLIILSSKKSKK